jgi:hypothetical protein
MSVISGKSSPNENPLVKAKGRRTSRVRAKAEIA